MLCAASRRVGAASTRTANQPISRPLAIEAGAKVKRPLQDQFYGDRSATLEDPFGHVWTVATHIEDVPPEEIDRRMAAMMQPPPAQ